MKRTAKYKSLTIAEVEALHEQGVETCERCGSPDLIGFLMVGRTGVGGEGFGDEIQSLSGLQCGNCGLMQEVELKKGRLVEGKEMGEGEGKEIEARERKKEVWN